MDLDISFTDLNKENFIFKKIEGEAFSKQCVLNKLSFELTETIDNELEKSYHFSICHFIIGVLTLYESFLQFKQINLCATIAAKVLFFYFSILQSS